MSGRAIRILPIMMILLLAGAGCVNAPVSTLTPEQAASSLVFGSESEIVVRPTVLGVGGKLVGWFGGEEEERVVEIVDWVVGEKATLSWSITTQVETTDSTAARMAYEERYANSPVGVEIPKPPQPVYETRTLAGQIASESMASADTLLLPQAWPEGDGGTVERSLIWLSRASYDELINTRKTAVSLGLFDESLVRVTEATGQLKSLVENVAGLLAPFTGASKQEQEPEAAPTASLTTLEADPAWGEYALLVDGVRTGVRVVEAKNAFASYKILANPDNPLILEIQLTPLSQGSPELLSRAGVAKGFSGYEVTRVVTPSGDRHQP